jgi:hypothetical protein
MVGLGWATTDVVGFYGAVAISVTGFVLTMVGVTLSLVANTKKSILTAASQMPEVQQGKFPIVLAAANNTPEARKEVAELVAATPRNVIAMNPVSSREGRTSRE